MRLHLQTVCICKIRNNYHMLNLNAMHLTLTNRMDNSFQRTAWDFSGRMNLIAAHPFAHMVAIEKHLQSSYSLLF